MTKQKRYSPADLIELRYLFAAAENLWRHLVLQAAKERVAAGGKSDIGCCVLGAGISVQRSSRKASDWHIVIRPPKDAGQGASTWEGAPVDAVLKLLQDNGVEARYEMGIMD